MPDTINTQLGRLSATGMTYPVQSKSSGSHTITVSLTGTGSLAFVGALMGSNDNKNWVVAASVSASGTGTAVASAQTTNDYAYWALAASTLTGTDAVAAGVLLTQAFQLSPEAQQILAGGSLGLSPAILNFKRSNTEVSRAILSLAGAGIQRARWWYKGTSVQVGNGAAGAGWTANSKAYSYPMLMAAALAALGLNARADYSVGDGGTGSIANLKTFDTRWTTTGTAQVGGQSMGGQFIQLNAGDTATFTPGVTFDRAESTWAINTAAGAQFTISADGGTTPIGGNISASGGATALGAQTTTFPANSTTLTYKNTGTGPVFIQLTGVRTAAKPGIEIINAAAGGSTLTASTGLNWTVNSGGAGWGAVAAAEATDTSIKNVFNLECVINDAKLALGINVFLAAQTAWILSHQAKGEVHFRIPPTVADSTDGQANFVNRSVWNAYADAARDNAIALDCLVIDERITFPDWAKSYAQGFFQDGYHGNAGINQSGVRAYMSLAQRLMQG